MDTVITQMAAAIQTFEGWYDGSRSMTNNNPGNLKYAGQAGTTGADADGFAVFATYQDGWTALCKLLQYAFSGQSSVYKPTMSLTEFFVKYAEDAPGYADFVASQLGVTPDTTLDQIAVAAGTAGTAETGIAAGGSAFLTLAIIGGGLWLLYYLGAF